MIVHAYISKKSNSTEDADIHTMIFTLISSLSLALLLQSGLSSPEKTTLSAAQTQWASKGVPKAVSYSWMFLVNILFV